MLADANSLFDSFVLVYQCVQGLQAENNFKGTENNLKNLELKVQLDRIDPFQL